MVGSWLTGVALAGCSTPPDPTLPVPDSVPAPDPESIESVLFLIGDAGDAFLSTSPTLARLQQDVEWWSWQLAADSAVGVFFLGDIRYPEGVRDEGTSQFEADTAVVMSQVRMVAGPMAQSRSARGYFIAGNHDWGLREHREGFVRLKNLDNLLIAATNRLEAQVSLVPAAGTGGPEVIDWGDHLRLLLLDTAWWLLTADGAQKQVVMDSISAVYSAAPDRQIVFMAHHPMNSAGPHGGQFSFWRTIGARYILFRSGAILQDLSSGPFRELEWFLRDLFAREESPLAFVGGHDHSLQVITGEEATDPKYNILSGSGSKLSEVGRSDGLVFGHSAPGYMKLLVERGGGITLLIEGVPSEYLRCPGGEPQRTECMAEGIAAYRTLYWTRLR